jgi:acetylornithine/N-succinyldiaminopimelate aminotransferase
MAVNQRPHQVFVRGAGAYLYDREGRRYLDWVQGWAVNCLGHLPAVIAQALSAQANTLINPGPAFYSEPAMELAELLTQSSCFDQVYFASSGAEANEGAIKLARKWGQRNKEGAFEIITLDNAFHGRTLATKSASGKPGWDTLFAPQVPGFPKARFNDLDSVRALIGVDTVAIMLEPTQGEAGVITADIDFLQGLRALCDAHQLLLIVDEVQTGCGRTGTLFAYEHYGIEPDIMTLGKGLGGGVPLSALLAKQACCCFEAGDQGGTFCGNALTCAAGVAVLNSLLADGFLASSQAVSEQLRSGLVDVAKEFQRGEVRGSGALLALELGRDIASEVVTLARERGLLLNAPRAHCLRFMPPLNSTADEVREGLRVLRQVLAALLKDDALPVVAAAPDSSRDALKVSVYDDRLHRAQVIALWSHVFGYETAHNAPELAIDRKLAMGDGLFFVALLGGAVAGTLMAGYDGHRGWLYSVGVHPTQQKQGVGAALIRHAESALRDRGCLKINLQIIGSNERVVGFYQTLGFVLEPRISMGKIIHYCSFQSSRNQFRESA